MALFWTVIGYGLTALGVLIFAAAVLTALGGLYVLLSSRLPALPSLDTPARTAVRLSETAGRRLGRALTWLALGLVLMQFAVVLLRYVFGYNDIAMQESITYMHGFFFMLTAGYTLMTGGHVRVDILYRGAGERQKAWTDLLGTYLFLLPFSVVILWTALLPSSGLTGLFEGNAHGYVQASWRVLEGSPDTSGIQARFLLKTAIPAFAVLTALHGAAFAMRAAFTLAGKPLPRPEEEAHGNP